MIKLTRMGVGVSDPPPASDTCPVLNDPPRPAGKFTGTCPGTVAGALQIHPPPVGVGGNGW